MLFGIPTMYGRLRREAERDRALAEALGGARLLVSGSAALPAGAEGGGRGVRFLDEQPRNDMGKVRKAELGS